MPRKRAPVATDGFFEALDAASKETALAIRDLVRRTAPSLTEGLFMGVPHWTGKDYVCYLADYSEHVNLGFHHGAKLKDPTGRLEGTGKGLRHVKVAKGFPIPKRDLAIIIRLAVAFDRR